MPNIKNTKLNLFTKEIDNEHSRKNFSNISDFLRDQPLLKGKFVFFTYTFSQAVTNAKIPHPLNFVPKDAFITSKLPASVDVTLNQENWNISSLDITTSGAVTIRMFIGTYAEGDV